MPEPFPSALIVEADVAGDDPAVILIFSRSRDPGANAVIPWLINQGHDVRRINRDGEDSATVSIEMSESDFRFRLDEAWLSISDVRSIWFRKGDFWFPTKTKTVGMPDRPALDAKLDATLAAETTVARRYFHYLLGEKGVRTLGNPILGNPNKLIVLHEARKVGLTIPRFEVVTRLKPEHLANPANYVTKTLSDGIYLWDFDDSRRGYFSFTEGLDEVLADARADGEIPLSLVQEKIDKEYEIRSFYIDGFFFSSAIHSQNNEQTSVDYRKYDYEKPNRNLPITLPDDVAAKLRALFARLELNTGSVDLIVDRQGNYVFLEINPFGQYGYLSEACNYGLHEIIARWLAEGIVHA